MHPLYGAQPVPYVPVRVVGRGRYTYAPPRYRTSQYRKTTIKSTIYIHLSVFVWNDLADPVFELWTGGFQKHGQGFLLV